MKSFSHAPATGAADERPHIARYFNRYGYYAAGFASMIALWWVLATFVFPSVLFPPPGRVLTRGITLVSNGELFKDIAASLNRIIAGFVLGSLVGVVVGLLMGSFTAVRNLLEPYIETLRFIPAVAMITIAVIWFGIGETSKVFIIFYGTVFVVVVTTAAGVTAVPQNKIRAALSMGATRAQLFFRVTLPSVVPDILTGMRVAMANAFTIIVAAELVAAQRGIGTILWNARVMMLTEDIFVALVVLAILGFCVDRIFRWTIRRYAGRYTSKR
jgi:ABC-type nitrate/sulfonate/bicarbonate transport system permease component